MHGTPMYYGANGQAYGYHNGEQFEDLNQNQKMALYNQNQIKQQNQQQAIQQTQTNQQNRQGSMSENQTNRQAAYGGQQENYQKQQQWYQEQQKQNPQRFQQSENNPFVAQGGALEAAPELLQNEGGGDRASSMSGRKPRWRWPAWRRWRRPQWAARRRWRLQRRWWRQGCSWRLPGRRRRRSQKIIR
jgi:hypothetical protein